MGYAAMRCGLLPERRALASMATSLRESVANAECIRATEKVELKIVPVSICKRISVQVSQQFPRRPGLKRSRPKGPFLSCDQLFANNKYVSLSAQQVFSKDATQRC